MSRYRVQAFAWRDLLAYGVEEFHAAAIGRMPRQNGVTLYDMVKDQPIASGAVSTLWPGLGFAWIFTCADPHAHKTAIARFALDQLRARLLAFRRVEAVVRVDQLYVRRFAQWLGFQEVLYKPQCGANGEDYIELALIVEEYQAWLAK